MKRIHFISGLPRSGSTLLASILKQNPSFRAGMSGPLCNIFLAVRASLSDLNEFSLHVTDACRARILRAVLEAFYCDPPDAVVFDTNRGWCSQLPAISQLCPDSRVICCVRNIAWILDSFEQQVQANALRVSRMFRQEGPTGRSDAGINVVDRVDQLMKQQVGGPLNGLRQAWFSNYAGRLVVVRYESLVEHPGEVMRRLYELLDEVPFSHDFESVGYDEPEFDERLGLPGLHTVRPRVEFTKRQTILPPDLFAMHDRSFWNMPGQNPRGVPLL